MLEAHVAFEVEAWTESLTATLDEQIASVFDWLDSVSLGSIVSDADLDAVIDSLSVPDVSAEVLAAGERAAGVRATVGDLLRREDYDRAVGSFAAMTGLHEALVDQLTTSKVYADLISHVLFSGIRNYVMTESPIARVPGASSLMRIGQSAFDAAAPRLSKGIERQLTAFVSSNLQDSLRDSREFLTSVIDEETIGAVAEEAWERNAGTTVAELVELLPRDAMVDLFDTGRAAWTHLVRTDTFRELLRSALQANAARSVSDLLMESGVTPEAVCAAARPWILRAADDGLLEELVRRRLTAFYSAHT